VKLSARLKGGEPWEFRWLGHPAAFPRPAAFLTSGGAPPPTPGGRVVKKGPGVDRRVLDPLLGAACGGPLDAPSHPWPRGVNGTNKPRDDGLPWDSHVATRTCANTCESAGEPPPEGSGFPGITKKEHRRRWGDT